MSGEEKTWAPPPAGSPCWIEIPAQDVEAVKKFYSGLFPSWTWREATEEHPAESASLYSFSKPDGFGGGIIKMPEECKANIQQMGRGMTVYYFVPSIEEIQKQIEGLGGKLCLPKTREGKNGWYACFTDVEGNRFGVYELDPSGPQGSS